MFIGFLSGSHKKEFGGDLGSGIPLAAKRYGHICAAGQGCLTIVQKPVQTRFKLQNMKARFESRSVLGATNVWHDCSARTFCNRLESFPCALKIYWVLECSYTSVLARVLVFALGGSENLAQVQKGNQNTCLFQPSSFGEASLKGGLVGGVTGGSLNAILAQCQNGF